MGKSIRHHFFYSHPIDVLWEYLTKPELLSLWLMPNDFELKLGHKFTFKTNPLPQFSCDGNFHCKILEIIPYKKLVYSWNAGPGDGSHNLSSVVEWTLIEKNNGTELLLVHSGFTDENLDIYTAMTDGWLKNLQKIENHLKASIQ